MDAAVPAHRHGCPQYIDAFCRAGANGEDVGDFRAGFGFAKADGGFKGDFVKGVEGMFDADGFDGGVGFVDAGFDLWGRLLVGGGPVRSGALLGGGLNKNGMD